MQVRFTPEEEAPSAQMAIKSGTDAEHLVKDAALRLLEEENRFLTAVEKGIAAVERASLSRSKKWTPASSACSCVKCESANRFPPPTTEEHE